MPLKGKYQKYNAALAALTVSKTLDYNNFRVIENGIKNVIKNTGLKGRYEFINKKPDIILDSAHNPEGVVNFLSEFNLHKKNYTKCSLLFGVMRDKAVKDMLAILVKNFDGIFVTSIDNKRACKISELEEFANEIKVNVTKVENPGQFVSDFMNEDESKCLVVLGSMYLLGNIKSHIEKLKIAWHYF